MVKIRLSSMDMERGCLVVVEGVDGAGKSSLVRRLGERMRREHGIDVVLSREPTDGVYGAKVRASASTGRLPLEEELELFEADRREHVQGLISPALGRGAWVVLDRYYFSTAAYQGARGANPQEILRRNEAFATQPDLVLLLDCAPEVSLQRVQARGDVANEFERLDALERVRNIFLSIERPFIRRIDASVSPDSVFDACWAQLEEVLLTRR
jgi:dTMP kinase